jgi:hypothetical protein
VSALVVWATWSSTRVVRGLGAGVDVGAAAPDISPPPCCVEVYRCHPWSLGQLGRRLVWGAASGPAWCVLCRMVFGWFSL